MIIDMLPKLFLHHELISLKDVFYNKNRKKKNGMFLCLNIFTMVTFNF